LRPFAGPLADLAGADDRVRKLVFHDLLEAGFHVARRGLLALTDVGLDAFVAAFDGVLDVRSEVLRPQEPA
jgi:glutamate-1-semialdehyde 2,1-aminomutase